LKRLFSRLRHTAILRQVQAFHADTNGAFAVIFAVAAVSLIAVGGAAVDYGMWQHAITSARNNADAGALAGAISKEDNLSKIRAIVTGFAAQGVPLTELTVTEVTYDKQTDEVGVRIEGTYRTAFVSLVGVHSLPVVAIATSQRAQSGGLEVALVLDNTWSMSDKDGSGQSKINALKTASLNLVSKLWVQDKDDSVRIGLVPYADYVNVGVNNRYEPWISVPANYSATTPKTCETKTTVPGKCTKGAPKTCTRTRDGVVESYDCTPQTCEPPKTVEPYESCTGGGTSNYKWFGCVRSRNTGDLRLNDTKPTSVYTGFLATSQTCLNPIVPLTTNQGTVKSNLAQMITNIGGYKPLTYIPAGMVWGINLLSPTPPFSEAAEYDPANLEPRKALILMTDGDNTMYFNASDGRHIDNTSGANAATAANRKKKTDEDTMALCNYAKQQNIEIFVVSFGTLLPASDTLLRGCASGTDHYYSAANAKELDDAFQKIADSLEVVRLTR
jgi:Flp pilus assembly protein TadG